MKFPLLVLLVITPAVLGWWEIGNVNQIYAIPPISFNKACIDVSDCFSYLCNNRGTVPYVAFRWVSDSVQVDISKVYTPSVVSTACVECSSTYGLYNFSTTILGQGSYISKTTPVWGDACTANSITCTFVMNIMKNVPSVNTIIFHTITTGSKNESYPFTVNNVCTASTGVTPSSTGTTSTSSSGAPTTSGGLPQLSSGGNKITNHFTDTIMKWLRLR